MFRRKNLWMVHVLGWLLFLSLPLTIMSREPDPDVEVKLLKSGLFWLFVVLYATVFYVNVLFLIPRLFLRERYGLFAGAFLLGFLMIFYLQPFENLVFQKFHRTENQGPPPFGDGRFREPPRERGFGREMPPPEPWRAERPTVDFVGLVLFVVVWAIALVTNISEQWRLSEQKVIMSQADKVQAELSFFKAQINPHFLFNTLNNIYSLAVSSSVNTAPSIMKLSQMMRYITDEAANDFVDVEDEIICIGNYIDLQKLRLNDKTSVDFKVEGQAVGIKIAPLILMTFVENAFKYGVSGHHQAQISIQIGIEETGITFFCRNHIFETGADQESTGIGIANTQKRLDFLYPGKYLLNISDLEGIFEVNLHIS